MSCSVKRDWLTDGLLLSLTATFQPPDFTADMYDTIKEDDLDFEDIEWQKWLQGLINSGAVPIHASCVSQNTNLHVCLRGVLLLVSNKYLGFEHWPETFGMFSMWMCLSCLESAWHKSFWQAQNCLIYCNKKEPGKCGKA